MPTEQDEEETLFEASSRGLFSWEVALNELRCLFQYLVITFSEP
jgi:hypothetical protein